MGKVSVETKEVVQRRIADALAKYGRRHDFSEILVEYPDISKTTFYRWVRQIEASGVPRNKALTAITEAIESETTTLGSAGAVVARDVEVIEAQLPSMMGPDKLTGLKIVDIAKRLQDCITAADKLKKFALTPSGDIRNPRLFLMSSEHLRRTLETASKVATQLFDIASIEQLHQVIFDRLRERDPVLVRQILSDLTELKNSWSPIIR